MRGVVSWTVLVVSLAVFQTSLLSQVLVSSYKPDLLLLLMVVLALRASFGVSLPAAYGLGLLKDCLSGIYFGLNAFSFLVVYLVLRLLSDRLYVQNAFLLVLTVSVATVATMFMNLILLSIFSEATGLFSSLMATLVPHLLMNAFAASLVATVPEFVTARYSR